MRVFYLIHVKEKVIHHRYCTSLMGRKKVLYDVPYFPPFLRAKSCVSLSNFLNYNYAGTTNF